MSFAIPSRRLLLGAGGRIPFRLWINGVLHERLTDDDTGQVLADDDTSEPLYDEVQ